MLAVRIINRLSIFLIFFVAPHVRATTFANQFIEFELPPQWAACTLEGAEWVCQNSLADKKRDAIIILAAKLKGNQDSLDQYESYLKQPKKWTSVQNRPVQSEPKYTKPATFGTQAWIDSLHLESEIPGFYTRYLATIKEDIAVLVTYSINKDKYNEYRPAFEAMVNTLKVFRKPGEGINMKSQGSNIFAIENIPTNLSPGTFTNLPPKPEGGTGGGTPSSSSSDDENMLYLILGVAVVAFIIWRRKQG